MVGFMMAIALGIANVDYGTCYIISFYFAFEWMNESKLDLGSDA